MTSTFKLSEEDKKAKNREKARRWRSLHPGAASKASNEWRKRNKKAVATYMRKWKARNPKRVRNTQLKINYGITLEQRDQMLASQGGVCALCKQENTAIRDWHVDHCHTTNKVRGILCHHCNTMLGLAKDSTDILSAAIAYLSKHNAAENAI